jgi:hypothetical protein
MRHQHKAERKKAEGKNKMKSEQKRGKKKMEGKNAIDICLLIF